jgi:hypothetical protein
MALPPLSSAPSLSRSLIGAQTESVPFSAKIAGQTHTAHVDYSAGEYVAADPTVFGSVATGPSPEAAEIAFMNRIDLLA